MRANFFVIIIVTKNKYFDSFGVYFCGRSQNIVTTQPNCRKVKNSIVIKIILAANFKSAKIIIVTTTKTVNGNKKWLYSKALGLEKENEKKLKQYYCKHKNVRENIHRTFHRAHRNQFECRFFPNDQCSKYGFLIVDRYMHIVQCIKSKTKTLLIRLRCVFFIFFLFFFILFHSNSLKLIEKGNNIIFDLLMQDGCNLHSVGRCSFISHPTFQYITNRRKKMSCNHRH